MFVHLRTIAALFALAPTAACQAQPIASSRDAPLILERTISLRDVRGRIDHLAIDVAHHRVFVAELGNGSVEAVDLVSGASLGRVTGLREPQGLAYLPARDEVAVASGGDGTVRFYRADDLALAGQVEVGGDADNLRVDSTGRPVVGYGAGALAVIDPATRHVTATLSLPVHPEGFRLRGGEVFVNLPDAGKIAVGDLGSGKITATWRGAYGLNFPMAIDAAQTRLAVVFRLPARLQVLDAGTGATVLDRPTCGDADEVFFDDARHRVYVICGAGTVDAVNTADPGRSVRVVTRNGARTGLYVSEIDRLLVAAPARDGGEAALMIYRPQP